MREQARATAITKSRQDVRKTRQLAGGLLLGAALALGAAIETRAQEIETSDVMPDGRPVSFAELAERVSPAVVNITTSTTVAGPAGPQGLVPEGSPFEDFFRDFENGGPDAPRRASAAGSGFVIDEGGLIVTNNHVIVDADEITIEFQDGATLPAELVGTDPTTDIALLRVEPDGPLPYVTFGDSDAVGSRVGDWVMVIGNPLGIGFSASAGIVSARNRALSGTYDDYIQTDATINRGNSGGPLFNMDGDVIGVVTAILSPDGRSIGIGFAMSSAVTTNVVAQLEEYGETRRGWLGVRIQNVTPDMIDAIEGLTEAAGAMVTDVPEGPAADAGILSGDIILTFDGQAVADTGELVRIVGNSPVGKVVDVEVLRDGEMTNVAVTLGRREEAQGIETAPEAVPEPEPPAPAEMQMLGLSLSELNQDLADEFGLPESEGLVITGIEPMSDAEGKGLMPGDVITEVGQQPVMTIDQFEERVEQARQAGRKSILLLVRRAGDPRFVALVLDED